MTEYIPTPPSGMLGDGLYPGAPATPTRDEAVLITREMADAGAKAIADERKRVGLQYPDTLAVLAYQAMAPLAPAPASGRVDAVAVKALEWVHDGEHYRADAGFEIKYSVFRRLDGWFDAVLLGTAIGHGYLSATTAKEACQSDYEQRIRSALSPAATPVSEAEPDWMEAQQVRKRRGVEIMQEYAWGNLTPLGVANHLMRAGFNIDYAQKVANDLAKPASSPAGGGVHEAAIGLLSELDAYCVGSRAYDRRVNEARRALKAALSQSTSVERVEE